MIKRLLIAVVVTVGLSLPTLAQSQLTYTINNDITVAADDSAAVRYRIDVNGNPDSQLTFGVVGFDLRNIAVKVAGKTVEATAAQTETQLLPYTTLTFDVPDSVSGSWKLAIDYETDSLVQRAQSGGSSLIVAAPARDASVKSEQLQLSLPLGSELPVAFGLDPDSSTIDGEQQSYSYKFNGPRTSATVLRFGGAQTNSYQLSSTLRNDSWWWQTLRLALPPDTAQQQSFLASVTPTPDEVRLDQFGNMFVEYKLAPRSTVAVEAELTLKVQPLAYDLSRAENSINKQDYQLYLDTNGRYGDGTIMSGEDPVELVRSLLQRATENDSAPSQLVADVRASGLPAREVSGWVAAAAESEPVQHRWAQVYLPEVGWVVLDPGLNSEFGGFGLSGAWRLTQAIVVDQTTADQFLHGEAALSNVDAPNSEVSFEPTKPSVDSTNYVLLPGISLRRNVVQLPSGVARDSVAITDGNQAHSLGSLAPLQTAVRSELALGANSWASERLGVGTLEGDEFSELNSTTTSTNWLPLLGLIGLGGAVWLGLWLHGRRTHRGSQHLSVHDPDEVDVREPEQLLQSDQEYPNDE